MPRAVPDGGEPPGATALRLCRIALHAPLGLRPQDGARYAASRARRRPSAPPPFAAPQQQQAPPQLRPLSDPAGTVIAGGRLPSTRRCV